MIRSNFTKPNPTVLCDWFPQVDAATLLKRMPWLKLRKTTGKPDPKGKYVNGSAGVSAEPHALVKGWLLQYKNKNYIITWYC